MASDGSLLFDTGLDNSGFTKGIAGLKTAALAAAAAVTAAFTTAAAAAVNVGTSYTTAMSQVSATMGITRASEDYSLLAASAEEMGAKTKYSATQAGEALNYLALAGYNAEKAVSALPTVLNVAAAGGIDLAYSSDMITDSMSALGLGMNELEGFADKLAKTSQKSNTSISQLGEAILTVGGTAKTLSGGVTELNTMLGLIADNGIKGAEGGTALRNIILSLSAPTDTAAAAMERLNISAFDGSGKMRELSDIFADFNNALAPLTDQQKTQALNEIFNKVDLKAVNALLGTSAERFDELAGYIENSTGAAEEMAKTMSDNLQGDMDAFNSALEGLGITAFNKFEQPLRTAVQSVTADISALNAEIKGGELSESVDKISSSIGNLAKNLGDFVANDAMPVIISSMAAIADHGEQVIDTLVSIGVAIAVFKGLTAFTKFESSIRRANLALLEMEARLGGAAVSQAYLSGSLTVTQTVAGVFTGRITAATLATSAFTAVANSPILLAAVLTGVVVAVAKYTSSLAEATEATKEAAEAADNYASALEQQEKQIAKNNASLDADKSELKTKIDIYEQLRIQYEKTGEGEQDLIEITKEIQELSPVTISFIDEETQKYVSLAGAVDDVVAAMERRHKLQNAEDDYDFAQNELPELYKQRETLSQDLADLERQFQELTGINSDEANPFNTLIGNTGGDWYRAGLIKNKIKEAQKEMTELNSSIADAESRSADALKVIHDTYLGESKSSSEAIAQYYDTAAEQHRIAATEYADKIIEENRKALKRKERETQKLQDGFKELDHLYAIGEISDEKELYNNKLTLWNEYGDKSNQEHWQYYEELHSYETKFAEESEKEEKERLEKLKDLNEETAEALLDIERDRYKKQLSITTTGINSLLSEYKKKMGELESNISSYKAKLLSVGDIFSITESTDENGKKTRKYTVENIREQMNEMRKYHNYVKQLKASGASEGLLSELTSMDFADGAQFGKYLTSMSSAEFAQINEFYKQRDALADELSQDLYAGEAEKINNALLSAVDIAISQLPEQAQAAGRQFLSDFISGLDLSTEDISDEISNFVSGFTEIYNSSLENLDLEHKFTVTLGGMNTYSMGQELARQLTAGFNDEIERSVPEIKLGQVNAGVQLSGNAGKTASSSANNSKTTETVIFENTNHITVELDGEKISEKTEKRIAEKQRRTG